MFANPLSRELRSGFSMVCALFDIVKMTNNILAIGRFTLHSCFHIPFTLERLWLSQLLVNTPFKPAFPHRGLFFV